MILRLPRTLLNALLLGWDSSVFSWEGRGPPGSTDSAKAQWTRLHPTCLHCPDTAAASRFKRCLLSTLPTEKASAIFSLSSLSSPPRTAPSHQQRTGSWPHTALPLKLLSPRAPTPTAHDSPLGKTPSYLSAVITRGLHTLCDEAQLLLPLYHLCLRLPQEKEGWWTCKVLERGPP